MVQQCAGCELPIADKFLFKVLDRVWHANCVQCTDCKCSLTERCFSRDGKLYCKEDFYRRYGTKCSGCEQGISPNDLVRRAKHLVYHVQCFVCSFCKRQISTGDELYHIGEGSFICKEDYYRHHHHNINDEVEEDQKDLSYGLDEDLDAALSTKRRGPRTTIKAKQLEALRATFTATPKPSRSIREKLAQETGLNMRVIQVWFQNRRSKERRLKQSGGQTQSSRSSRPSRRSRSSRHGDREDPNEIDSEIQSPKTPLIGYHSQELSAQAPRYVSPSNYSDYYSQNSPISDGLLMNNSQVQQVGSDFGSPPSIRPNSMNDMPAEVNGLANVRHVSNNQSVTFVGHSPGGAGFNQTSEPQASLVNPASTEVW